MPILKPEYIITKIFEDFDVTDADFDLCESVYYSSLVLDKSYKVCVTFEPKSITFFVFDYSKDESIGFELDTIFQIIDNENNEYTDEINVLYSSGDFIDTYFYLVRYRCKELSIETQVLSGSLFDKYVTNTKVGDQI